MTKNKVFAAFAVLAVAAAALALDRNTPARTGETVAVAAGENLGAGWLCGIGADGQAYAATTGKGLRIVGRSESRAAAGEPVVLRRGVFRWDAAPGETNTAADIGRTVYVAKTNSAYTVSVSQQTGVTTNNAAGTIIDVDAEGVWVRSGF
jgi:hypothetical protein